MALLFMPLLFSCASYNNKLTKYYGEVRSANFKAANNILENSSFIKSNRNELLYYFEKGKLYHLQKQYDSSNTYFNLADKLLETTNKNVGDVALSALTTPMNKKYLGEDFERYLMHYYKALNYLYLDRPNEALVEARRITLTANYLSDYKKTGSNKYTKDAFAFNLQGIIYEVNGDINNAFIAYRNAADIYLANNGNFYGVAMPKQLMQDVLRTAQAMGLGDEQTKYTKLFNIEVNNVKAPYGEAIIFLEQGWAPIKTEQNITLTKIGNGTFFSYTDAYGNSVDIPFNFGYYNQLNNNTLDASNVRMLRVALPNYAPSSKLQQLPTIIVNGINQTPTLAYDVNSIAIATLQERMFTEIADAIARQLVKKMVEKGLSAGTEEVAKKNSKEKDDEKKKSNAAAAGAMAGLLVNIVNNVTEKADTRNWQSLPAFISYIRIPLLAGENTVQLQYGSNRKTIKYFGKQGLGLQVASWNAKIVD